jgi:hypothetical protein
MAAAQRYGLRTGSTAKASWPAGARVLTSHVAAEWLADAIDQDEYLAGLSSQLGLGRLSAAVWGDEICVSAHARPAELVHASLAVARGIRTWMPVITPSPLRDVIRVLPAFGSADSMYAAHGRLCAQACRPAFRQDRGESLGRALMTLLTREGLALKSVTLRKQGAEAPRHVRLCAAR